MADDYPPDEPVTQDARLQDLQRGYRARLNSSSFLHHPVRNRTELELAVHKMVIQLDKLRPEPLRWVRETAIPDSPPAAAPPAPPDFRRDLRATFEEFLPRLQQARQGVSGEAEAAREADAYARLAAEHALPEELLRRELLALAKRLKEDKQEPPLERARAAYAAKDYALAEKLALEAAGAAETARPPAIKDLIQALLEAARAADEQIAYDRALTHLRRAEKYTDPQRDPTTWADVQHQLAYVLDDQGKHREVEAVLRRVIPVRERVLGPEHPDTLRSRNNLALALNAQGQHAAAERECRAVLAIRERVLGPEHPDTLSSRMNLANALYAQGQHAEAEREYRAVLAVRERVLGPEHPDTLTSCYNLALALEKQGKKDEAKPFAQRAYEVGQRVLGKQHPNVSRFKKVWDRLQAAK